MSDDLPQQPPVEPEQLDARGLKCPEPLLLVRNRVRSMVPGAELRVLATDPTTTVDLQKFCRFMEHDLLLCAESAGEFEYIIRKGGA